MSTSQLVQAQAIEYLRSLYASIEVDHHGNAVKVCWGHHCEVTDTGSSNNLLRRKENLKLRNQSLICGLGI
ncbi:MAG: hypothetical protein F6K23_13395 [Okeania sp. SIO2C9]|uniref:hypothetical protein n=1 Tax=Okeania sp. SIO2C9 TaxID=2607791 RepID=UPI0013C06F68|nr:hypothetical protein [Okeania sp. SIO2C9]NEQ73957.1 hypothetical protein [Okeania sp. SIO2C9]